MKEFRLRLPKHIHKQLKLEAEFLDQSLNDRIVSILVRGANIEQLMCLYENKQEHMLRRIQEILDKMETK